jgi:hypothetical protein
MALSWFRWTAIAVIGSLMIFYAALRAPDNSSRARAIRMRAAMPRDTIEDRLRDQTNLASYAAYHLAARLKSLRLIDSVDRVRAHSTRTEQFRVFISTDLSPALRTRIESLIEKARRAKPGDRVGIDVVAVLDSARTVRGVPYMESGTRVGYAMPKQAGDRCVIYLRLADPVQSDRALTGEFGSDAAINQFLGPCAYFGAFGMPGAQVSSWFASIGWKLAVDGSWDPNTAPRKLTMYRDYMMYARRDVNGIPCLVGEERACLAAAGLADSLRRPASGDMQFMHLGIYRFGTNSFGARGGGVLAAAVRQLGRDRFSRFWTSDQPVPQAFASAAGEPMGKWLSQWMQGEYGDIERGPNASRFALVSGFLAIGISMGATLLIAMKRHYS